MLRKIHSVKWKQMLQCTMKTVTLKQVNYYRQKEKLVKKIGFDN